MFTNENTKPAKTRAIVPLMWIMTIISQSLIWSGGEDEYPVMIPVFVSAQIVLLCAVLYEKGLVSGFERAEKYHQISLNEME